MTDDWTTIVPKPGDIASTARQLLSLAISPTDVRTDGNGSEFRVPPYLAERYNAPAEAPAEASPKTRRRTKKEEGDE